MPTNYHTREHNLNDIIFNTYADVRPLPISDDFYPQTNACDYNRLWNHKHSNWKKKKKWLSADFEKCRERGEPFFPRCHPPANVSKQGTNEKHKNREPKHSRESRDSGHLFSVSLFLLLLSSFVKGFLFSLVVQHLWSKWSEKETETWKKAKKRKEKKWKRSAFR